MKHVISILKGGRPSRKGILFLTALAFFAMSIASTLPTQSAKVYADPSADVVQQHADAFCNTNVRPAYRTMCVKAYSAMFVQHTAAQQKATCYKNGDPTQALYSDAQQQNACLQGMSAGINEGASYSKANPSTVTPTSDASIISDAKATDACQVGSSEAKNSCIAGYIAGRKGNPSESTICKNNATLDDYKVTDTNSCQKGYQDGQNDKNGTNPSHITATPSTVADGTTPSGSGGSDTPTCESSGFILSWFFCGIIEGLGKATDGIYSDIIQPLLITNPIDLSGSKDDPSHTYQVWSQFRIYGDIFLVIALLVVVFGESIGGGLIDAYTAKKVLPRLLLAAILINLSLYLVALSVDVTNIIGNGMFSLIEQPFKSAHAFTLRPSGTSSTLGILSFLGGSIWAYAAGAALLEFLLAFFLLPAFLLMLAVMATVLLRRGLILLLIFISPVAFALYCLPNTEKYFRQWWDLLLKTLMVYPIIALVFAMANVLSVTIGETTGGNGFAKVMADFLSMVALVAPLGLIPFAFKLAGGVLGRVHDIASNYGKRAHQGILGSEQDPDSWRRRSRGKLNQRMGEKGIDARGLRTNFIPPTNPFTGSGRKQWRENREARRSASRILTGQQFFENDNIARANKGSDQYYAAVASPELAEKNLNKAIARGDDAGAASWRQAIAMSRLTPSTPAIRMAAAQQLATTGFVVAQGQEGYNELGEMMADITGAQVTRDASGNINGARGNRAASWADAMDNAQFGLKGAGRFDLAGINRGAGYKPRSGTDKASLYELANAKAESITGMIDGIAVGPISEEHAIVYKELQAMLPSAKGATRDEIVKQMQGLEGRGVQTYMQAPSGRTTPAGAQVTRQVRINYDASNTTHATWDPEEKARGWRTENRAETKADLAQDKARSYERPDPNNL